LAFDPSAAISCGQNLECEQLSASGVAFIGRLRGKYGRFENLSHGYVNIAGNKSVEKRDLTTQPEELK